MARPEKVAKVEEVRQDLSGAAATLLTHYRGLSVTELAELRAKLREANAEMKVVKNTLTKRAAEAAGIDGLDEMLEGPVSLVLCAEDPVGPAKALKAFAKDHPDLVLRGGYLDGEVLDAEEALKLADLESREELLAKLAGLMQGALSGTARLLLAATEKQARLLQALVDAGGVEAKGFTPSAPAAAPEAAAPEPTAEPEAEVAPAAEPEAEVAPAAEPESAPKEPVAEAADADGSSTDTEAASGDEPVADETTTGA